MDMFIVRIKSNLVFVCRSKMTCLWCEHGNRHGYRDGGKKLLDLSVGDRT